MYFVVVELKQHIHTTELYWEVFGKAEHHFLEQFTVPTGNQVRLIIFSSVAGDNEWEMETTGDTFTTQASCNMIVSENMFTCLVLLIPFI